MGTVHAKEISDPSDEGIGNYGQRKVNFAGVEARVDKIHVEGLTRTKDDIVIETVQDLFKVSDFQELVIAIHNTRDKLGNLGCFKNVAVQIDTSKGADSTANGVEVTFYVKELKRLTGGVNTMVGSNEGSLVVSVMAPNILGRGERLQLECSRGYRQTNNLSLSFIKPLRTKYDAIFTTALFQNSSDWPCSGYRCTERGLLLDLAFSSNPMVKHNLQYEGVWREMGTVSKTSSMRVREENGHSLKSALRHILTIDKRDAVIFPTFGTLFRFTTELAGFGGDVCFAKNEFYWQRNVSLYEDVVLQGTLSAGILTKLPFSPYNTAGLPDKLYLGGPLSVRGFQTRGIGPRVDGNSIGANVMWGAGLHLFTPLPFRPGRGGFGDLFRVHFFGTLGQCKDINFDDDSSETFKTLFDKFRSSYGLGLALRLRQLAQVELNFAIPLTKLDSDAIRPGLQFGVGVQFL